jgi:hypothetical protein
MRQMTAEEFEAALDQIGVTHRGFGRLVDLDERTVRRMVAGDREVMQSIAILITIMIKKKISVAQLLKLMGDPRDPREFTDQRVKEQ